MSKRRKTTKTRNDSDVNEAGDDADANDANDVNEAYATNDDFELKRKEKRQNVIDMFFRELEFFASFLLFR